MSQAPYVHPDPDPRRLRREYIAEVTEFARRHQPLPEYADVLIAFLADLVLERALLATILSTARDVKIVHRSDVFLNVWR
ncbi:hypothetical protein OG205_10555 [Lentzea sp. NBC_00516]|uniref:hypothetical protein n=1 Tax=Lentzea sp. NBC_00516 TaxID=2903582 RepID=UPI002E8202C5|nr:hypothetical protein [Lentzea sp. NBC_00516]WUD27405.1 hypothetical protein OG205_10555 [Lentzea sp. NBC_00516]